MPEIQSDPVDVVEDIKSEITCAKDLNLELAGARGRFFRNINPSFRRNELDVFFKPNYITIGPHQLHSSFREDNNEKEKRIYLDSFLTRAKEKASLELDAFVKLIKDSEAEIRGWYTDIFLWSLTDAELEKYIKMIMIDAGFIIELFYRAYHKKERKGSDFLFERQGTIQHIRRDLFLGQYQLPFFILKRIYGLAFPSGTPFVVLACHFFRPYYNQNAPIGELMKPQGRGYRDKLESAKHLTDFLRTLQLPTHPIPSSTSLRSSTEEDLDLEASIDVRGEYLYSAVVLRKAGVKFKASSSRCLLDITFNKSNGELNIPAPLKIDEWTESFFRNLIRWERSCYPTEASICDYLFMMGYLVKSAGDVDLLVRKRIIINQLGTHEAVANLFNRLCKYIAPPEDNTYSDIYKEINAYTAVHHHSWIATLKLEYFSNIWKGSATIAAIVLLLLTLIQTICSVVQVL